MRRVVYLFLFCAAAIASPAQTLTTLVYFDGTNGANPYAPLIQGSDGNFYGTTSYGGTRYGTVFQITPEGTLTTLYIFCKTDCTDGAAPNAGLVQGTDGNFYGTTVNGGANFNGTVFEISPEGVLSTLHSFAFTEGTNPFAGLVQGTDGNFYGTTVYGGAYCGGSGGCGTIFKITPDGTLTTLYSFKGYPSDGEYPFAGLVQGPDGNLYGTTFLGGTSGGGTVFKITPEGTLTTIYSFCELANCADGYQPHAGLVQGTDGNFYGTTIGGANGAGTVFKITLAGTLTTLHSFVFTDGSHPYAGLVQATDGNFYGTTEDGGKGFGTVFRMTPGGDLTSLYSFNRSDGSYPQAGLAQATDGSFYGTTAYGGASDDGTVFKLSVPPLFTLSVVKNGSGTVTSGDGDINCGGTCSHTYVNGTLVTLTASPDQGWAFTNWSGCDNVNGNVCTVTMNSAREVTATFTATYQLTVSVTGNGTVTSKDGYINCGSTCSHTYQSGSQVTLTATPDSGWAFTGWSGCDYVNANTCTLTMNAARNVTATFKLLYALSINKTGKGTVTGGNGHIYCGNVCSYSYIDGTQVGLTAIPAPGYTFSSWSGCDNVNGDFCSVTMSAAKTVTATFEVANVTLTSLTFNPTFVKGGRLSAATLTLSAPAPSGGVGVALGSDHPGVAHPPSFVVVPGGKTSISFAVNTFPVKMRTLVGLTATAGSSQVTGTLTVGTAAQSQSARE